VFCMNDCTVAAVPAVFLEAPNEVVNGKGQETGELAPDGTKSSSTAGTQERGSGHSKCRKFRFGGTLAGIFTAMSIILPAKDFYLEKFGAHPLVMGILFFIVSFLTPFCEMTSGRLQNSAALSRWFPTEVWGRKAPWLVTHMVVLAVAASILYLPPMKSNKFVIHAWFFVISVIMFWAISTTIIAFESTRQEIYPYNEERCQVEMFCKITCIVGILIGMAPMLVLLANSSLHFRLAASAFWLVGVLTWGLQAKPIWMEAKAETAVQEESSICSDLKSCWSSCAFRHLCMVRLYDGLYQGIYTSNLFYYLTYILEMHGVERSGWLVLVGVATVGGELIMAFYVSNRLNERKFQFKLQAFVIRNRIMNCIVGIVLLVLPVVLYGHKALGRGNKALNMTRLLFLAWAATNRFFQAPFTFWRVGAQCWVIDEDIHEGKGVRREAAFISVFSAAQNFARAISSAFAFLGIGLAGLAPTDCDTQCEDSLGGFSSLVDCTSACREKSILDQPESVRIYIRACFIIGLSLCDILIICHALAFPIKGIRLAKLYNNQTLALGGKVKGIYTGIMRGPRLSPVQMVEKQHGESKILRMDCDAMAGIEQVMLSAPRPGSPGRRNTKKGISASVILTLPDLVQTKEMNTGLSQEDFVCAADESPVAGTLRDHLAQHAGFVRSPVASIPKPPDDSNSPMESAVPNGSSYSSAAAEEPKAVAEPVAAAELEKPATAAGDITAVDEIQVEEVQGFMCKVCFV